MSDEIEVFLRTVLSRTKEHQQAFKLLYAAKLYGVAFGLLRQEIDTLIRVMYLQQIVSTRLEAEKLITKTLQGVRWTYTTKKGKSATIFDRFMIEELDKNLGLIGWENMIYKFGCNLIHLSNFHDYHDTDPFLSLNNSEKNEIIYYLKEYHNFSAANLTLENFIQYLPDVMTKVIDCSVGEISNLKAQLLSHP